MTTYVLSLTGDEEKAANATHWTRFRQAKLISVSRSTSDSVPADPTGQDSIIVRQPGTPEQRRRHGTHDPAALAALLLRTLDVQNGQGVVLADFDNEDFAADVVARIAALGRAVSCTGRVENFAPRASLRARLSRA